MKSGLKIHLKPNERIFVNGGVLRVDRKVTIEFLNEVVFLLEANVIAEGDATTPLRQLYFIVQSMLIEPKSRDLTLQIFDHTHRMLIGSFENADVRDGLVEVGLLVEAGRHFDALRKIRELLPVEQQALERLSELAAEPSVDGSAGGVKVVA